MSFVLADQQGWLGTTTDSTSPPAPFTVVPIGDFAALRRAVANDTPTSTSSTSELHADFFMWEHFTTKHFWDNGELKRLGEIYTPWPSWVIAARHGQDSALEQLYSKLDQGVRHYNQNPDEAIEYITSAMHYSVDDARAWMKTVQFVQNVKGVSPQMVGDTLTVLRKAGVLSAKSGEGEGKREQISDIVSVTRSD